MIRSTVEVGRVRGVNNNEQQRWDLTVAGRAHRVEIEGSFSRTTSWYVGDELVGQKKTSDERVQLDGAQHPATAGQAVGVKFDGLGRVRRVTLYEGDESTGAMAQAVLGTGGIDFDPAPGSRAAARQELIRQHPRRHAAIAVAGGVAKVVVPLVLGVFVVRFAIQLPWPNWHIPWPNINLPSIPWPNIPWPNIPWPDINLPDWQLPGWLSWIADRIKYVWPILLACLLAKSEINRQRKQDALKAELKQRQSAEDQERDPSEPLC